MVYLMPRGVPWAGFPLRSATFIHNFRKKYFTQLHILVRSWDQIKNANPHCLEGAPFLEIDNHMGLFRRFELATHIQYLQWNSDECTPRGV